MTFHCPLVVEDVVSVVAVFSTGTEGGDIVLGGVDSESTGRGKVLLAQPADGASVVSSVLLIETLGVFSNPARLRYEYQR